MFSPKKYTLSKLKTMLIFRNTLYAVALFVYGFLLWYDNTQIKGEYGSGWTLLAVIFMVVSLVLCFCEMRIVDKKGYLILPVTRFFLFGGKVLCCVATVLLTAIILQWWIALVISIVMLIAMITAICLLFQRLSKDNTYYVDYTLSTIRTDSKYRSPIAGAIVSGVLLIVFAVWLVIAIIMQQTSYKVISTPILLFGISLYCFVYYLIVIKHNKSTQKQNEVQQIENKTKK